MKYIDYKDIKVITSIGGGPIGGGWTAYFLSKGYTVKSYLHDEAEEKDFLKIVKTGWKSLCSLGLDKGASLDSLQIHYELGKAVEDTEFIQESCPEVLSIKQDLYQKLGTLVPPSVIISSSTSGFMMTDIQLHCATPERTVVGHPFNPPYLLPLVEIVGGRKTDADCISWVEGFYQRLGKAPLVMKKEIPGFLATRLQEAIWREALHMVANNEATPAQIDLALKNGPAPRMVTQGQCMAFHVACGEGGMATNLDQFGPALKLPWTRLEAPELTPELRNSMVDGCNEMAEGQSFEELVEKRDSKIVKILKILRE